MCILMFILAVVHRKIDLRLHYYCIVAVILFSLQKIATTADRHCCTAEENVAST